MTLDEMKSRLTAAYVDADVEVFDMTGTGDHWQVAIKSNAFKGMSRILAHKSVMGVFEAELKTGEVHALTIKTSPKD